MRRILKKLQTPLPHETVFNAADNPYTESEFLKFVRIIGFLMILSNTGMKNFIGLISMVLVSLMTTLDGLNDMVDNREIGGFH